VVLGVVEAVVEVVVFIVVGVRDALVVVVAVKG